MVFRSDFGFPPPKKRTIVHNLQSFVDFSVCSFGGWQDLLFPVYIPPIPLPFIEIFKSREYWKLCVSLEIKLTFFTVKVELAMSEFVCGEYFGVYRLDASDDI
ncbi:hypothetical protein AA313_de0201268 [Arthrobotrys entomopaga]|nr:hypothetical protein AA313_de0201268 [Arthrobotrys entomopaga]